MNDPQSLLPGSTLGVFGGGQLGRMFAMAAAQMGYRVEVFAPEPDCPASHVATRHTQAPYDDDNAVIEFARRCDVVTLEFENVPVRCLTLAGQYTHTRPGPDMLTAAQDRLLERQFLDRAGLPTAAHASVTSIEELNRAARRVGLPGVLKSARFGYDGRGQTRIADEHQIERAWGELGVDRAIYEAWVDYQCEVSVLVARSPGGAIQPFGPIENHHANHILDLSVVPARVNSCTAAEAVSLAEHVANAAQLEGIICVEMFVQRDGHLLINELAPRPHNSGHLTIDACGTSQFEQQVRAVCNLPLSDMKLLSPSAMVNLLGDRWHAGEPDWVAALAEPDAHLHLYGKTGVRPGRKMGHLTVLRGSADAAADAARRVADQAALRPSAMVSGQARTDG